VKRAEENLKLHTWHHEYMHSLDGGLEDNPELQLPLVSYECHFPLLSNQQVSGVLLGPYITSWPIC